MICFNHGNSLGDAVAVIRKTPRVVRFAAKAGLWNIPVMGSFVNAAGAVKVYRQRDYKGDAATVAEREKGNLEMFKTMIDAIRSGECVGFAPEGESKFRPHMSASLRLGAAKVAIESVRLAVEAGDTAFTVSLIPTSLVYTHREKFRSDLVINSILYPFALYSFTLFSLNSTVESVLSSST